jgi:hypothetical protein
MRAAERTARVLLIGIAWTTGVGMTCVGLAAIVVKVVAPLAIGVAWLTAAVCITLLRPAVGTAVVMVVSAATGVVAALAIAYERSQSRWLYDEGLVILWSVVGIASGAAFVVAGLLAAGRMCQHRPERDRLERLPGDS